MNQSKISKKEKAKNFIKQHEAILRCPYCHEALLLKDHSLYCKNKHTFDVSKKGYLNFATSKGDAHYDHALFEARKSMINDGLFTKIEEHIREIMVRYISSKEKSTVLDAGSGEGALIARLHSSFKGYSASFFGLDLSKEAIALATSEQSEIGWFVGDLANIPLQNRSVDIILNVFSPANYAEFMRVLQPEGILIKVIPLEGHFKEVRSLSHKETYSPAQTELIKTTLEHHGKIQSSTRVSYKFPLTTQQQHLITTMSPLSKNMVEMDFDSNHVSVDVEILVATFNREF